MSLFLSESMLSTAFWSELESDLYSSDAETVVDAILRHTAEIAPKFGTKTGSISTGSIRAIWALSKYFSPTNVVEVGTYIGRTTLAAAFGSASSNKQIHTCDLSFDCWEPPTNFGDASIRYYGKTSSSDMLKEIASTLSKIDMMIVDGRLQPDDIKYIAKLRHPDTVFVVDDFEGVEKGVENVLLLRSAFPDLVLLSPNRKSGVSWSNSHCIATLISGKKITLTRQQCRPFHMM
jgi:hypothetical protein